MTTTLFALALALSAASAPESLATNVAPASGPHAPVAAAPPDTFVRELSRLGLRRVRVVARGRELVLEHPAFLRDGIGWESVEGFPRRRPALVAGADWDSVKPPPNPLPWDRIERLETPRVNRASSATIGGIAAFVLLGLPAIGLTAAVEEYDNRRSDGSLLRAGVGFAIVATLVGASLGHLVIPPTSRWHPAPWPPPAAADSAAARARPADR